MLGRRGLLIGGVAAASSLYLPAIVRSSALMRLSGAPLIYDERRFWIEGVTDGGRRVIERVDAYSLTTNKFRRIVGMGDELGAWDKPGRPLAVAHRLTRFIENGRLKKEASRVRIVAPPQWPTHSASSHWDRIQVRPPTGQEAE